MKKFFSIICLGVMFIAGCSETEEFGFTITDILSEEQLKYSEEAYYVVPGKDLLKINATWSPLDAEVGFGFIDKETGTEYLVGSYGNGGWQGEIETSDLKVGEYYIMVKKVDETVDINIVSHFRWE